MTQIPLQPAASDASNLAKAQAPVVDNPPLSSSPVLPAETTNANTLRRQLFTTVLPLTLAPLAITSAIGYTIVQRDTTQDLNERIEGQALVAEELVAEELRDQIELIETITDNPLLQSLAKASSEIVIEENLRDTAPEAIAERFSQSKLVRPDQAVNDYLKKVAEVEGYAELILTERNGFNVAYTDLPSDFDQSTDQWWQQGRANQTWASDPEYDESTDTFGFTVSRRVEDLQTGEFLGVLKAFITSDEFDEVVDFLRDGGIVGSQRVEVIDASAGRLVSAYTEQGEQRPADAEEALQITGDRVISEIVSRAASTVQVLQTVDEADLSSFEADLRDEYPIRNVSARSVSRGEAEGSTALRELIVSFDFEGKRYAVATTPGIDLVAVSSMDLSEVRARGQGFLLLFSAIGLALAAVGSLFTVGLSQRLSSPLDELSNSARQVAAGNLDVTAQLRGTSETQTLAQTFNQLVRRVKGSLQEQTRNAEEANLLAFITGANLNSPDALDTLFSQTTQQARRLLSADRVVVYRFDTNDWSGRIVAESQDNSLPSAFAQGLSDSCIPESVRDNYRSEGIYLHNNVATTQLHPKHLKLLEDLQVKSVVGAPIISQGQLYGLIIAHHCHKLHAWQPNEINFMTRLGQQLGLVLERVTLQEQTQRLAEEQRQIKETLQKNALQLLMDVDPVGDGDLTVRARVTEDEIGTVADSYNATIQSLRKIVAQVQEAARQVADTTATSEESAQSLSKAALQQAQDIGEALDRAQEMANSAQLVAANAAKAEEAVQAAALTVQEGDAAMNRTVDGILGIRETVAETAKKVKRLGESSQKISNVVNLISGFAAQTNMLALNASIEASRAGEDSKGFAVVAEEVRELARQSAEATTEIEKLVADIQSETNEVVVAMETGTEQVVSGTKLVDETRESLTKITETSLQISALVESITQATVVQTQASEAVTGVMTNVKAIATQNTQEASKVYESFEDLNSVAKTLQAEVDRFKVN